MSLQEANRHTTLPQVIRKLLASRDYSEQEIHDFFSWDLGKLPDLTQMHDMDKATSRLVTAITEQEHIGIYGDYDVDGTTSCALFYHFFNMLPEFQPQVSLIQPSRFVEGYGIHPSGIDQAIDQKINLLITVDCGISNYEAAEYARERGLDLIITDHHKDALEEMVPAFAVVNPNRRDEPQDSKLRPLAGVGVAFALCWQAKKELERLGHSCPSLYPLLQFVAVGTICDLAHLTPMNLKLVRHGLKQLPTSSYPGLKAFLSPEERKLTMISSEKLSFHIGPMINSKGRLDHPEMALKLLVSEDSSEAYQYYSHLEVSNKERKVIQFEVTESAKQQFEHSLRGGEPLVAIVYQEDWHEGVIGIVASKLVDAYKVPAIVFTDSEKEGIIKASARSAGELNIFDCLNQCRSFFTKFGGHKAAAGLSMPKENYGDFKTQMTSILQDIPVSLRTRQEHVDLEIHFDEITPELVMALESLEPFGMGNPKPVFKMRDFAITSYDILKGLHVRWTLERGGRYLKGISFHMIGKYGVPHPEELFEASRRGDPLTAYFTLGINRFNGNEYIQLMVERITNDELP